MKSIKQISINQNRARWFGILICAFCWAYTLVTRFTQFFMLGRFEKLAWLGGAFIATSLFSVFIFKKLLPENLQSFNFHSSIKAFSSCLLLTVVLLLLFYKPPYFPKQQLLEIIPYQSNESNTTCNMVEITSIQRIKLPGGQYFPIPHDRMNLQGDWVISPNQEADNITWIGDPNAKISFNRLMQDGIQIIFQVGPKMCSTRVMWDGQMYDLNLYAPIQSTRTIQLNPSLNFQRTDLTRKILVGSAIAADILGLSALSVIAGLLLFPDAFGSKKSTTFGRSLLACTGILMMLMGLTYGANPPVHFQDAKLEAAVRGVLEQPNGYIRYHSLTTIAELDASYYEITSLEGIQALRNLVSLKLEGNFITDLNPLSQLSRLRQLNLRTNPIANIEPLSKLQKLESLDLRSNQISDISPLAQLTQLKDLNLRDNVINDISPLAGLPRIKNLNLRGNTIQDISALAKQKELRELNLHANEISDITALASLTRLKSLNLGNNPGILSIAALQNLNDLQSLNLRNIPLGNQVSQLRSYPKLNDLNVRGCGITDVSVLGDLMAQGALQDNPRSGLRSQLDIRDNPIEISHSDGYAAIRPYWESISTRIPFRLPVFATRAAPVFSHSSGFYKQSFNLILSTEDDQAVIHYTLDGSEPSLDSPIYSQPLHIQSRAGQPDVLAEIRTTAQYWRKPIGEVFKATVVRAKAFYPDGSHSTTETQTYFVDPNINTRYSLPIFSIVSDPDHFFDYEQGIYVMGRLWDENRDFNIDWLPHPANYMQKGEVWERPVHIEFFEPQGQARWAQNAGIRIHGFFTRAARLKSLRLYARAGYDQSDQFEYDFFPGLRDAVFSEKIQTFKTLLLRNSGNDWGFTLIRDAMMQALISHTSLDTQAYRPVIVFLNGEYWGIHNLRESMDEHYLSSKYLLDTDNIVILENNAEIQFGKAGDDAPYQALLDFIKTNDMTNALTYNQIATQMDVENYIDYLVTEIYIMNSDWPHNNIKFWRHKTDAYQPDAPYGHDGRWRWIVFDTDSGFGLNTALREEEYDDNTLAQALYQPGAREWSGFLFRSLIENPQFFNQFINRFADHLNTTFTPERVIGIIDRMQAEIRPEIPEHINRWRLMDNSIAVWEQNVEVLRSFARNRPTYVRQHILSQFELPGTATITLQSDSRQGYLRINSIDITTDTPGVLDAEQWSGIYFQGIPIQISAIPNPGYQFSGWEGIDQSEPNLQLVLNKDLTLRAKFVPIAESP